jgi:beta-glucosidase-like glycosyl hydrolase
VSACGRAAIEGFLSVGVIPVAKHFPGHGDTSLDSHVAVPRVDADLPLLSRREFRPFEAAVQASIPMVMTGHVLVPALEPDPRTTATLSRAIVTGQLRERMKFGGVIVTDALEMVGATGLGSHGEVAVRAIEAGVDLLLYSKLSPGPEEALAALQEAVRSGRLTEARVA